MDYIYDYFKTNHFYQLCFSLLQIHFSVSVTSQIEENDMQNKPPVPKFTAYSIKVAKLYSIYTLTPFGWTFAHEKGNILWKMGSSF